MVALETNTSNLEYAKINIERNNLCSMITLFPQGQKEHIFQEYFDTRMEDTVNCRYEFCICNPPFFDSLSETSTTRNPQKRPPPHNCPTGYKEELSCLGGEVKFVERIIDESLKYKHQIRYG